MVNFEDFKISKKEDTVAEEIASEVLDKIKYDPVMAHEIGSLLIEYAERDMAEALREGLEL